MRTVTARWFCSCPTTRVSLIRTATVSDPSLVATGGFSFSAVEGAASSSQTVATFTDPGGAEVVGNYTATVNWGDTTSSPGTVVLLGGGNYRVDAGAHTYAEEGTYTVNVTLTHDLLPPVTTPDQSITIADQQPTNLASANLPASGQEGDLRLEFGNVLGSLTLHQ